MAGAVAISNPWCFLPHGESAPLIGGSWAPPPPPRHLRLLYVVGAGYVGSTLRNVTHDGITSSSSSISFLYSWSLYLWRYCVGAAVETLVLLLLHVTS